jgi:hypothetical protein
VNHRVAIVVAMTRAVMPGAMPMATPRESHNSHRAVVVMATKSPAISKLADTIRIRRGP